LALAAVELLAAEPGLPVPELAVRLGCLQNPLYAILGTLEREGRLVKDGRQWASRLP
jgi:DNA-binding IclR family transcriptional regulator